MIGTALYFAHPAGRNVFPAAGDTVRVAHGVSGRLGRVRSISPGHLIVQYDRGDREIIDPTRRPVWVIR
jgi:hypothetical protein